MVVMVSSLLVVVGLVVHITPVPLGVQAEAVADLRAADAGRRVVHDRGVRRDGKEDRNVRRAASPAESGWECAARGSRGCGQRA